MKVSKAQREFMFNTGWAINPTLGDMFQNPYNLDARHVEAELRELEEVRRIKDNLMNAYAQNLLQILEAIKEGKEEL